MGAKSGTRPDGADRRLDTADAWALGHEAVDLTISRVVADDAVSEISP